MLPNQVYYFNIGTGRWGGTFDFRIIDRQAYRSAPIGLLNRLLVSALRLAIAVFGRPSISSNIIVDLLQGPAGTGWNRYSLTKWGVTLCLFNDTYQLEADGERVRVTTDLRYGPVPGLLTDHVTYSARIFDGGFRSRYEGLKLLGATWLAAYEIAPNQRHVSGRLTCEWAEATEQMFRLGS